MDYVEFASGLPPDRTVTFESAEECEETMQRWGINQEMQQLGTGKYRSDLAVLTTEEAELYVDRFSKAVTMNLEAPADAVGILFPRSASDQFLVCGQNVGNRKLIVFPDGSDADIVIPDLAGSEAITLPTERFIQLIEVLSPMYDWQKGLTMIEGNMKQMGTLRQALFSLIAQPEPEPDAEQLSNLLAATVLLITDSPCQRARVEKLHTPNAQRRIAKQAQTYIDEHYQLAIHMEDLCRLTGVGVRTLQRCFRQYFDFTISDYVKTVRLNAALRELTAAHPVVNSVTEIAMRNGYTHLGRFSCEFRSRFGQSPREALVTTASQKS